MKKAFLQMHTAIFLWGFTGVLGRAISLDSVWLVWYRLLITIISLWILYFIIKKITKISLSSALAIGGIGFILVLHWICFYASIRYSNVTISLTCLSTTALLSAVMEPLILRKRFDAFEIILGLFAIAGIVIIYNTHIQFSLGIIIGLLSAVLTVLASVLNKRIVDKYRPEQITLYQLTGGFLALTILLPLAYLLFPPHSIISYGNRLVMAIYIKLGLYHLYFLSLYPLLKKAIGIYSKSCTDPGACVRNYSRFHLL